MRIFLRIFFLSLLPLFLTAQINPLFNEITVRQADSLKNFISKTSNDTLKMEALRDLALHYLDINSDSASKYILLELPIVEKLNLKLWKADAYDLYSIALNNKGNYSKSLEQVTEAMQIARKNTMQNPAYPVPCRAFPAED